MKPILILSVLLCALGGLAKAAERPNILFILADDQGWADLNTAMDSSVPEGVCSFFHTPNMDRLAREGIRFSSGYSSAPLCTPTRRSIQFGMTPARQRGTEFVSGSFTPKGHLSIPQALKQANPLYRCAHFGKWGEVMSGKSYADKNPEANPAALGYDQSDGLTGNVTGTFYHPTYLPKDAHRNYICEPDADPKRTFSVTRRSIAFMERQVREKHPFYLQVSYYAIHTAYQARQATLDKYAGRGEPPRQVLAGVAPMLEDLDTGVGQLLDAIDKLGIGENTYVFFSSDNGGEPGRMPAERLTQPPRNHPLRMTKQYLYEGGIRVPFIVRGPGVKAGAICRQPVVQYDLLPTFYDLAGGREPLPAEIDGGSLRPLLQDPANAAVKRPLPGLVFHRPLLSAQKHSAIRVGDFKLVITWSGPWQVEKRELFNLAKDIGEQQNLAETMPEKADEMSAALIAYLKSVNAEVAVPTAPKKKP
jgi:arylsulfatase A-like enzyme